MTRQSDFVLLAGPPAFRLTRVFDAPRALVYKCWMEASHLARWWGPKTFVCPVCEIDARVGGVWDYTMHGPDGTDYPNYVSYTEIAAPHLIRYDHGIDAASPAMFKAVIAFEADGGKTRVSLRLKLADAKVRDDMVAFGAVEGGWQTLSRLDAFLNGAIAVTAPYNPNTKAARA